MITIYNFRHGFATNSSSSHSVVMLPPSAVGTLGDDEMGARHEYGWGDFTLTSPESKLRYLAAQFFCNYGNDSTAVREIIDLIGSEVADYREDMEREFNSCEPLLTGYIDPTTGRHHVDNDASRPYVDHQSVMSFGPYQPELLKDLIGFFASPRVVVFGGNDNSDYEPPVPAGSVEVKDLKALMHDGPDEWRKAMRSRREGDYWTLFSSHNGTKVRFSLEPGAEPWVKASAPELVDVKITDFCPKGCQFCYQGSTPAGQHAPYEEIERIFSLLAEMGVFEVAIGGGEPTDHPRFADILKLAADHKIVPNFTTLSDRWLNDPEIVKAVKAHVGGIGVSTLSSKDLILRGQIMKALDRKAYDDFGVLVQHVVGSVPLSVTAEVIAACSKTWTPLLLLGYKTVGFGGSYTRHDTDVEEVKRTLVAALEDFRSSLSVDTAFVDNYPDVIAALEVPPALVSSPEGKFSCYIDAVTSRMGPSSYVEDSRLTPMVFDRAGFLKVFAEY